MACWAGSSSMPSAPAVKAALSTWVVLQQFCNLPTPGHDAAFHSVVHASRLEQQPVTE